MRTDVFCPFCGAQGNGRPVLVKLQAFFRIDDGAPPYWIYTCQRCGYAEMHEERVRR